MSFIKSVVKSVGSFFTGGPVAAALSLGADLLQRSDQRSAASAANRFSADMSNTAYQRAMADMRAAGLNPILAAKLGGASTPTGVLADTTNIGSGVTTAMESRRLDADVGLKEAEKLAAQAQAEKFSAEVGLTQEQTENVKQATIKVIEEVKYVKANTDYRKAMTAIPGIVDKVVQDYVMPLFEAGRNAAMPAGGNDMFPWYTDRGIGQRIGAFLREQARKSIEIWVRKDASDYDQETGITAGDF